MKKSTVRKDMLRGELVSLLPRLRNFARSLTKNSEKADDLVQAACENALCRLDQFQEGTRFESWMYRIIYTRWIDWLRKVKAQTNHIEVLSNNIRSETAAADSNIRFDAKLDIKRALGTLPDEHLAAIMLVCMEGYTYSEAAEVMDVPTGTVASRVARARTVLGSFLSPRQGQQNCSSGNVQKEVRR